MADNTTWLECGYNWTGPVLGTTALGSTDSVVAGYIACLLACLFFGTGFVPLKFVEAGDGFLVQWIYCSGIWLVGLTMQLIREQPVFFPMNLIGGVIWALGNCTVVPIIQTIGLSLGILVWNCSNVLVGWATGRFGWFGLCPQVPSSEILNYLGVIFCIMACCAYIAVKPETKVTKPTCCKRKRQTPSELTMAAGLKYNDDDKITPPRKQVVAFLPNLTGQWRRALGITLALLSGCCYGVQFLIATVIQNHEVVNGARSSQNGLDYVFTQYCGIYLTSTVVLIGYMLVTGTPMVFKPSLFLPVMCGGIMWGIATCCFFLANSTLSPAISYPIIATVPGMIATIWGILLFHEIHGIRNFLVLTAAFTLTLAGALLTALSL